MNVLAKEKGLQQNIKCDTLKPVTKASEAAKGERRAVYSEVWLELASLNQWWVDKVKQRYVWYLCVLPT